MTPTPAGQPSPSLDQRPRTAMSVWEVTPLYTVATNTPPKTCHAGGEGGEDVVIPMTTSSSSVVLKEKKKKK